MVEHIKIRKSPHTWVARTKGAILAESSDALEVREGDNPVVIYFPRADVGMALLEKTASSTTCPHKGTASYFAFHGKNGTIPDVAWSYEAPQKNVAEITGHVAFYQGKVTVEQF